jgi:hypothetical protein
MTVGSNDGGIKYLWGQMMVGWENFMGSNDGGVKYSGVSYTFPIEGWRH